MDHSARALRDASRRSSAARDRIREQGGITALVHCLQAVPDPEIKRCVCQAVGNLALGNASNCVAIREVGGFRALVACVRGDQHEDVSREAIQALARLAADHAPSRDAVREAGGIAALVECVPLASKSVKQVAVAALLAAVAGNATNCEAAVRLGAAGTMVACMDSLCFLLSGAAAQVLSVLGDPASDAHLFADVHVMVEADLKLYAGVDLMHWQDVAPDRRFRVRRTLCVNDLMPKICDHFAVDPQRARFWLLTVRTNSTWRTSRLISRREMTQPLSRRMAVLPAPMCLLMETSSAEAKPFFEPMEDKAMIYVKFYDPQRQKLQFVLRKLVHLDQRIRSLAQELRAAVGLHPRTPIRYFEEIRFHPARMDRLEPNETLRGAELFNGDILVFQVDPSLLKDKASLRFPCVPEYYQWLVTSEERQAHASEPLMASSPLTVTAEALNSRAASPPPPKYHGTPAACVACRADMKQPVALIPCGHTPVCKVCLERGQLITCPMCRPRERNFIQVYL